MLRLEDLREERGLTQNEIAEAIGTSRTNIGRWEKGLNEPSYTFVVKLANFFNVTVDYLIGNEEPARVEGISPLKLEPEEEELLRIYRNASRGGKNILLGNARNIEKNDEYLKKQRRA